MYGGVFYGGSGYPEDVPVFQPQRCNTQSFKFYGAVLALFAAATLSLGIANVVLTREAYCNPWMDAAPVYCSNTREPYIWTWVASGIWGSAPIFLAGVFGMCLAANPAGWTRTFSLLISFSALVFAPGIVVLSSIEAWRGSASNWHFYTHMDGDVMAGNIMPPEDNPYRAKFALPLVIAILGGIMFLMSAVVAMMVCCCGASIGLQVSFNAEFFGAAKGPAPAPVIPRDVYLPSRPQVRTYMDVEAYHPPGPPPAIYQPPVRFNPVGSGVQYGNFPSRAQFGVGGYIGAGTGMGGGAFNSPNPSYMWR